MRLFLRTLLAGALAGLFVVNGHEAAVADVDPLGCRLFAVENDEVTGQDFYGFLDGQAVSHGYVSVNCRVMVGGMTQAQTGTAIGFGVASTTAQVSFRASDSDVVTVCTDVTDPDGSATSCSDGTVTPIPPQVVRDAADDVLGVLVSIVEPPACFLLRKRAGSYDRVFVNSQGDVFVDGEPVVDCPPYDLGLGSPVQGVGVRVAVAGF